MPTDPDTKERHDTLLHGEQQLTNGHREDHETLVTQVVITSKCLRVLLVKLDEVERKFATMLERCAAHHSADNAKPHPINWPTAGIICGILLTLLKIFTTGGTQP